MGKLYFLKGYNYIKHQDSNSNFIGKYNCINGSYLGFCNKNIYIYTYIIHQAQSQKNDLDII